MKLLSLDNPLERKYQQNKNLPRDSCQTIVVVVNNSYVGECYVW